MIREADGLGFKAKFAAGHIEILQQFQQVLRRV
jgi:hypothetical protein